MGPWTHGGWSNTDGRRLGSVDFATDTAEFYREHVLLPVLRAPPEGRRRTRGCRVPCVFETGTNVVAPLPRVAGAGAEARTLYFRDGGRAVVRSADGSRWRRDAYVSDPAKPVPLVGYTALTMPEEYMVSDQRFAATRPDVLVYVTEPLEEDLAIAGPVSPKLFVSTTGTDADWIVKLIDVYPPDRSTPGAARSADVVGAARHAGRLSTARPRLAAARQVPPELGDARAVRAGAGRGGRRSTMPDVNHVFRRGHRVMVQVQSTWFPLIDRNPQTFVDIPTAKPEDFRAATQRVMRSRAQPSGVEVSVLPALQDEA